MRASPFAPFAGLAALSLGTLGTARAHAPPLRIELTPQPASEAQPNEGALSAPCPAGTLPDGDVCVRLPGDEADPGEDALAAENAHRERTGRWTIYEQIPRLPDRPASYDAYVYPVPPGLPGGRYVVSGYDLDRPDDSQRRGRKLHAVGHGGVDLPDPRGTPVMLVPLEHQVGDADVIYVGPLIGTTVVTRHTVREGGRLRDYVLLFGHLDAPAAGLAAGKALKGGEQIGFVGDTGSPELVHRTSKRGASARGSTSRAYVRTRSGGAILEAADATSCATPVTFCRGGTRSRIPPPGPHHSESRRTETPWIVAVGPKRHARGFVAPPP